MRKGPVLIRILSLFLALSLALPGPAAALRQTGAEESEKTKEQLISALASAEEKRETFLKAAEGRLNESGLFTGQEVGEMLGRLRKLDEALDRWPMNLGGDPVYPSIISRNVDDDTIAYVPVAQGSGYLIAFAPVFLGIRPVMGNQQVWESFKELAQLIKQGRKAGLWDLHAAFNLGGWFGRRWLSYSLGESLDDPKIHYDQDEFGRTYAFNAGVRVIDRPRLLRAIGSVRDGEIREMFKELDFKTEIKQGEWDALSFSKLKRRFKAKNIGTLEIYSKLFGIVDGLPEADVLAHVRGSKPLDYAVSRWGAGGLEGRPRQVQKTVDRWDAAIELMADYLRVVRNAPASLPPEYRVLKPILPGVATGMEEADLAARIPEWLRSVINPQGFLESVYRVHDPAIMTEKVAVLPDPELLPPGWTPKEMTGNLKGIFAWPERMNLRIDPWSEETEAAYRDQGYRVVRIVRDEKDTMRDPIPQELMLLALSQAVASGRDVFAINVTHYLALRGLTFEQVQAQLTDLYA